MLRRGISCKLLECVGLPSRQRLLCYRLSPSLSISIVAPLCKESSGERKKRFWGRHCYSDCWLVNYSTQIYKWLFPLWNLILSTSSLTKFKGTGGCQVGSERSDIEENLHGSVGRGMHASMRKRQSYAMQSSTFLSRFEKQLFNIAFEKRNLTSHT